MSNIFAFILPSVFGFKLMYDNLEKKDKLTLLIYECMIVLLSNIVSTILVLIKNGVDGSIIANVQNSMKFSVAYILLSIFVGCIIGFIIIFLDKYFNISIEVSHENKKNIKNNK